MGGWNGNGTKMKKDAEEILGVFFRRVWFGWFGLTDPESASRLSATTWS